MIKHFKSLGSQIFVYGLGDTINKVIAILIVPLFTRYLTPVDYGVAGIMAVTTALVVICCDLGLTNAFIRFYPDEKPAEKIKLVSTVQIVAFLLTATIAVVVIIFSASFSQLFFKTPDYHLAIVLSFASIPLSVAVNAPMNWLRMENKAKIYTSINVARVIMTVLLNVLFVVFLRKGVYGLLASNLITAALFAFFIGFYSLRKTGLVYSHPFFKKMLSFGSPFILGMISFWVINWIDRFVLSRISTLTEVGLYTLGYTMGMAIMFPVGAFSTAWPAFFMSVAQKPDAKKIYGLTMTYFSLVIGFFVLVISIFARDYFNFFTPEKFHSAYLVVPAITLAYALNGVFSIVAVGLFIKRKTLYEPIGEIIAMIVNLSLMFLLIPRFGKLGAAWATLGAFGVLSLTIYLFSLRFYPVKYEFGRLLKIVVVGFGLYFLCHNLYQPTLLNFGFRVLLVLLYPVILYLIGFFHESELGVIKNNFQRILKRKKYVPGS